MNTFCLGVKWHSNTDKKPPLLGLMGYLSFHSNTDKKSKFQLGTFMNLPTSFVTS
jgi:hypothetical protein